MGSLGASQSAHALSMSARSQRSMRVCPSRALRQTINAITDVSAPPKAAQDTRQLGKSGEQQAAACRSVNTGQDTRILPLRIAWTRVSDSTVLCSYRIGGHVHWRGGLVLGGSYRYQLSTVQLLLTLTDVFLVEKV